MSKQTGKKLIVPKWENKPCYKCSSLDRGITNFYDELFIINCDKCNVTIARGYFNTDYIEVYDSDPNDMEFLEDGIIT